MKIYFFNSHFSTLALREERKCSGRCRHLRKERTPERYAPENPAKIQWLTLQLHSKNLLTKKKTHSFPLISVS